MRLYRLLSRGLPDLAAKKKNKRLPNFYRLTRLAGAKEISKIETVS